MNSHTPTRKSDLFNTEILEDGSIISLSGWRGKKERILSLPIHPDGYKRVRLHKDGIRKSFKVHILVAEKYLGPKPTPQHEVRHIDGNRLNNHYQNLAWGTRKENADDRERHGRTSRGLKH